MMLHYSYIHRSVLAQGITRTDSVYKYHGVRVQFMVEGNFPQEASFTPQRSSSKRLSLQECLLPLIGIKLVYKLV